MDLSTVDKRAERSWNIHPYIHDMDSSELANTSFTPKYLLDFSTVCNWKILSERKGVVKSDFKRSHHP